jgi:hypothetical protein
MPIALPHCACGLVLAGALAGCGGGAARWAEDTCKTLPAEAAAKAAGVDVTGTAADSGVGDGYSGCNYTTKDGGTFSVQLRYDKTGTTTVDGTVAAVKADTSSDPQIDVPMSKGKALWNPKLHALSYYPDDPRLITVMPPGALKADGTSDPDDALKAKAVSIAEAAAK